MKRKIRFLRGTPGLSAYGVWLSMGNQGSEQAFFKSMVKEHCFVAAHTGGQTVEKNSPVLLYKQTGTCPVGRCLAEYIINTQETGTFALFLKDTEILNSRFSGTGAVRGLCVFDNLNKRNEIMLKNVGNTCKTSGENNAVDALLLLRLID